MIFVVFAIMMVIVYYSYKNTKLGLLSPVFISSGMLAVCSGIYCLYIFQVKNDITIETALILVFYVFCVSIAEYASNRIIIINKGTKRANLLSIKKCNMQISKIVTTVIFLLMIYAGIDRYLRLYQFTQLVGNTDIGNTILVARNYVTGVKTIENVALDINSPIVSVIYYLSTPICYFYIFWFVQKCTYKKKIDIILLLPVLANCVIGLSTTTRSYFIDIAVVFATSYFILSVEGNDKKPLRLRHFFFIIAFVALFFLGGYLMKGKSDSFSLFDQIFGYSAAGIYGLDDYIRSPWPSNIVFGTRTLKPVYDMLGSDATISINNVANTAFYWSQYGAGSNIYSSLVYPIQDYGVVGMCIVRMILVFVYVQLCHALWRSEIVDAKGIVLLYFVVQNVRALIYTPIGDSFYTIYLNVRTNIILIIAAIIVSRFILIYRLKDDKGNRRHSRFKLKYEV